MSPLPMMKSIKSFFTVWTEGQPQPDAIGGNAEEDTILLADASSTGPVFADRFKQLTADSQRAEAGVLAGTVRLVGLSDIQQELGSHWSTVASRARSIAETIIAKHIQLPDFYRAHDAETFLLCFSDSDKAAGDEIARRISAEIKAELLRQIPEAAATLSVNAFVAQVDSQAILDSGGSLSDALFSALQTIRVEAEEAERAFRAAILRNATVLFQPVWSPAEGEIGFNRCMLGSPSGAAMLKHLEAISEPDLVSEALGQLDCLVLTRSLQAVHRLLRSRQHTVILAPVQFETLNRRQLRAEYLRLCEAVPPQYKKFVMLEVLGAPLEADFERVVTVLKSVQAVASSLVLQVWPLDQMVAAPLAPILSGVSLVLPENGGGDLDVLQRRLRSYVTVTNANSMFAIAHGANSVALAQASINAGVHFVSGGAVHETMDTPKGLVPHNPLIRKQTERRIDPLR